MRALLLLATLALAMTAGCLDDDKGSGPADDDGARDAVAASNATVPAPIHVGASILLATDPANVATGTICMGPSFEAPCYFYEFSTPVTVDVAATLSWGLEANDFDLYLYQGDTQISSDGINTIGNVPPDLPATTQVMHVAALPPGDYTFWVVAWNAANDSFTLDAEFSAA